MTRPFSFHKVMLMRRVRNSHTVEFGDDIIRQNKIGGFKVLMQMSDG